MKLLIGLLFLCSNFSAAQIVSVAITRPLALDRLRQPPSDLFALTPSKVYALHDDGQSLEVVGSFPLPTYESPSDLVLGIINGQQDVIVSGSNPSAGGFISLYTSAGEKVRRWPSRRPLCGMDYDGRGTIYAASCDTNEIYQAALQGKDETSFVAEINGVHHLGPVIVDNTRGQLLVGEIDSGEIYAMDLKTHRSHLLARGFGTPQAFTFSADFRQLFVADSSHRVIYKLDLTMLSPSPVLFAVSTQFHGPDGLALLSSARVAVADDRANLILVVPASGQPKK